jgi:DNA-binding FrmR family transcriptional regulator
MNPNPDSDVLRRLRCAAGHLNAVIEMTESGQPCERVLYQLNAVQAALQAVGIKMLQCQAHSSLEIIVNSDSVSQRLNELQRLQSLYAVFLKYSNHKNEVRHE